MGSSTKGTCVTEEPGQIEGEILNLRRQILVLNDCSFREFNSAVPPYPAHALSADPRSQLSTSELNYRSFRGIAISVVSYT